MSEGLELEVNTVKAEARELAIAQSEDYVKAGVLWNAMRDLRGKVAETFDGIISKAHAAHKEAVAQKKRFDEPLDEAQRAIKRKMIDYDNEQERIRRLEQAKQEAEAKKKAEAEALELAAELEKAGLKKEAEFVIEFPEEPPQVIIPKTTPKVEGFRTRTMWTFELVDIHLVPDEYKFLQLDSKKIQAVVNRLKGATNIPGIKAREEKV